MRGRCSLASSLLAALLATGCISSRPLPPGEPIQLAPGEGILVVQVETNADLEYLELSGVRVVGRLEAGEHLRLVALTAGGYRWKAVGMDGIRWRTRVRGDTDFQVQAGRTSFVDLLRLTKSTGRLDLFQPDRTAVGMDRVQREFPGLLERYPPLYSGDARHVFLDHWRGPGSDADPSGGRE